MGSWEATQMGQLIPMAWRDIPDHMALCSAWSWEKKQIWEHTSSDGAVLPRHHCQCWNLAFLGMDEHLPAHGKWEINSLVCFAHVCSFYFTN